MSSGEEQILLRLLPLNHHRHRHHHHPLERYRGVDDLFQIRSNCFAQLEDCPAEPNRPEVIAIDDE